MKYYVVSDVHGFYTQLIKALTDAGFFEEKQEHRLIVCGDMLDRGKEAKKVIDFMCDLKDAGKLIYIQGNHEELMLRCMHEILQGDVYEIASGASIHYRNKTWDTLLQISEMSAGEVCICPNEMIRRVRESRYYRELLPMCENYFETEHYIFTHGWIPCHAHAVDYDVHYSYNPGWREANDTDWYRARWVNGMELACVHGILEPGKTVVCGHWTASYGHSAIEKDGRGIWYTDSDFTPFRADGIWAIDGSVAASGMLNCIVVED